MKNEILLRNLITIFFICTLILIFYVKYFKKIELYDDKNSKVKIILFWATWSHFCEEYLEKNTFMNTYQSLDIKNDVLFVQYEYDLDKSLANKYGVSSFPTIISIDKNGKLLDKFTGDRSNSSDLIDFSKKSLEKSNANRQ